MRLISIIVPAYNCEHYLEMAVNSALNQTYADIEIILIDDCSSDNTYMIAKNLASQDIRIKLYKNEQNLGVALTRNRGFSLSSGEFIAFLDADDIWLPEKLEKQLSFIDSNSLDLCYTAYSFINESGQSFGRPYFAPNYLTMRRLLHENVIGCSTVMLKSNWVKSTSMRKEYAHEDYVFWLELMQKGCKVGGLNQVLMNYRVLQYSRSANKKKAAGGRWRVYRDFLHMNIVQAAIVFVLYAVRGVMKHALNIR